MRKYVFKCVCVCVCAPRAVLACKGSQWQIQTSGKKKDKKMICLSAEPGGLHELVGEVVRTDEKMVAVVEEKEEEAVEEEAPLSC